jgi:aryl-alcohol dehydrogenase-like predicted oxidoreductase
MRQQQLGSSDLNLSAVGFGAWAAGGAGWAHGLGPQDDQDSIAAIHRAVRGGVNWVDTAPVYGLGHSEEVVGQALRGLAADERPYVFTKCGTEWDDQGHTPRTSTPDRIRPQLEASLRRLGVERVDLYQIHWARHYGEALEEAWGVLLDLQREGKIRWPGASNFSVEQLTACDALNHVASLQPPFSAINREAGEQLLPWCHAHETGVIVYSPMQSGLLTGAFSAERVAALPSNDVRQTKADFQPPRLQQNLAVADALAQVARRHDVSTAAAAVAWTLAWPGVTGAIVGGRRPEQVEDWLAAGSLVLTEEDMADVASAIEARGAGQGPLRPTT